MKIEEEIKQGKFKSEFHKLLINQLFTGKWMADIISKHLKPYDLTSEQYNVLRILRGQYPGAIAVNAICSRMIDKMSNVSRLIDKLKKKELVDRTVNFEDRRQMDITITEKGLSLLQIIDEKEDALISNFNHLSDEEALLLNDLLDKLRS